MKAQIKQLNACPCGAPAVCDDVKIGTEYEIFPFIFRRDQEWKCLVCKSTHKSLFVWCGARGSGHAGFLPAVLFHLDSNENV